MSNWYDEKAERLSNSEAYTLLRNISYPTLPSGDPNPHGDVYRASQNYFRQQVLSMDRKSGWILPPDEHRLPVDDIIESLVQKNTYPRIDATRHGVLPALRRDGPYDLVRNHLEFNASHFPDFDRDASIANDVKGHISLFEDIYDRLVEIVNIPHWELSHRQAMEERRERNDKRWEQGLPPLSIAVPTNSQELIVKHMETIINAADSLLELREIAKKEIPLLWVNEEKTGRKKQLWTQCFVVRMAHLWVLLTGAKPSVSADSPFATFVSECWNSYSENMPQVSFDRAIRNLEILG